MVMSYILKAERLYFKCSKHFRAHGQDMERKSGKLEDQKIAVRYRRLVRLATIMRNKNNWSSIQMSCVS